MTLNNNNNHHEHESPIKRSKGFESSLLGYIIHSIFGSHKDKKVISHTDRIDNRLNQELPKTVENKIDDITDITDITTSPTSTDGRFDADLTNYEHEASIFPDKKKPSKGTIFTILGIIAIIILKFKGLLLALLKFFPVVFKLKGLLTTGISMLLMIWVYASIYTWRFAVGFVLLLFIHEMGHALIIKLKGLKASAPIFIPFIGALIAMKDQPHDAQTEAYVGIGGPFLGTIGAIGCFLLYLVTNQALFLSLAYFGFFLNLFNLTPIRPLDGGRIVAAISTKIWILGIIVLAVEAFLFANPLLFMLLIMAIFSFFGGKEERNVYGETYYNVPVVTKVVFSLGYFGLVTFLGFATYYTHELLAKIAPVS